MTQTAQISPIARQNSSESHEPNALSKLPSPPQQNTAPSLLGVRDVIGPIMIGPSSSHTAGALRIASMTLKLLAAAPVRVEFYLYGSFAHTYHGHGTDRALLGGMLGFGADDVRIRDSFALAQERGLAFEFIAVPDVDTPHPNTVDVHVIDENGVETWVRGESIGGGAAQIRSINGVEVLLGGQYHSIVIKQKDVKGVLAHIAQKLSDFDINIATTRLFRERKGDIAYTVMETDDAINEDILLAIGDYPDILSVSLLPSDRSEDTHAPRSAEELAAEGLEPTGFGIDLTAEEATSLFEQLDFASGEELLSFCEKEHMPLSDAICRRERCLLASCGLAVDDTKRYLSEALRVMRASVDEALSNPRTSMGGLIGGEAQQARAYAEKTDSLADPLLAHAITYALAVLETNASMGKIVAAPTAGASGVLPAVLFALQEAHGLSDAQLERGLANAAAIGMLIMRNATVSGAEGGCQAEVGTASAMAASAAVELLGGTPQQCLAAAATALTGLMGLVCDPIGGLVEAPCQKRNATGAANALVAAQMALANISNLINFDETVWALYAVGRSLPFELRESALGGLAATPSACVLCAKCS